MVGPSPCSGERAAWEAGKDGRYAEKRFSEEVDGEWYAGFAVYDREDGKLLSLDFDGGDDGDGWAYLVLCERLANY